MRRVKPAQPVEVARRVVTTRVIWDQVAAEAKARGVDAGVVEGARRDPARPGAEDAMTLEEWSKATSEAVRAAGFEVEDYQGFPMVKTPAGFTEKVRLLDLDLPHGGTKRIYAQGVLITPGGGP